jgi:hypothetical protein
MGIIILMWHDRIHPSLPLHAIMAEGILKILSQSNVDAVQEA